MAMASTRKTVTLLKEDGSLTEKFSALLKDVFDVFDLDKDGMLSKEELRYYFSSLNGERLEDDSLEFHMMIICGNTIGFYLKDFYSFYEFQTKFNAHETISDLSKLFTQETLLEKLA